MTFFSVLEEMNLLLPLGLSGDTLKYMLAINMDIYRYILMAMLADFSAFFSTE